MTKICLFLSLVWISVSSTHTKSDWLEAGWGKVDGNKVRPFTKEEIEALIQNANYCPCGDRKIQACGNHWFGGCGGAQHWEWVCPDTEYNDGTSQSCNNGCFVHDYICSCKNYESFMGVHDWCASSSRRIMNSKVSGKCHSGTTCIIIHQYSEKILHKKGYHIKITPIRPPNDGNKESSQIVKSLIFNPNKKAPIYPWAHTPIYPETQIHSNNKNNREMCWGLRFYEFNVYLYKEKTELKEWTKFHIYKQNKYTLHYNDEIKIKLEILTRAWKIWQNLPEPDAQSYRMIDGNICAPLDISDEDLKKFWKDDKKRYKLDKL